MGKDSRSVNAGVDATDGIDKDQEEHLLSH
jgi:hypothetical protein